MRTVFALLLFSVAVLGGCGSEKEETQMEKITGEVTADNDAARELVEETPPEEEVREEIRTVKLCYDTDHGQVQWEPGSVFGFYDNAQRFEFNDTCQNQNYVIEYYCESEDPKQDIVLCRNGCVDAHCR